MADDIRYVGGNINGRYTLTARAGLRCFACRATSISPRRLTLSAPVSGEAGELVAFYFKDFGLLRGTVTRQLEFGFVADIAASEEEQARMAATIDWLRKKRTQLVSDHREHPRLPPRDPRSTLVLADGSVRDCFIIDMSQSGVAVSVDYTPEIGQVLAVGRVIGRVVRRLDEGFAVQFVAMHDVQELNRMLGPLA